MEFKNDGLYLPYDYVGLLVASRNSIGDRDFIGCTVWVLFVVADRKSSFSRTVCRGQAQVIN